MKKRFLGVTLLICLLITSLSPLLAQKGKTKPGAATPATAAKAAFDESLYNSMEWRNIGPWRGGRSAAVTGVPGKPNLFYFGSTGGGVWRTSDGGNTWENISTAFLADPSAPWRCLNTTTTSFTWAAAKKPCAAMCRTATACGNRKTPAKPGKTRD
jgi:hypothetical protein